MQEKARVFGLAAVRIFEKLPLIIAGTFKPAAFDPQSGHGKPVACQFFAARQLVQLTVLSTKQMALRKQLFPAPTMRDDADWESPAPRTSKKATYL